MRMSCPVQFLLTTVKNQTHSAMSSGLAHRLRGVVVLNRNLEKIEEANKVYISNQGATLWQKKINLKNRNVAA